MDNLIFLDMDGVLCTHKGSASVDEAGLMCYLDPVNVKLLERALRDFNAQIVLSSTWRLTRSLQDMKEVFKFSGAPRLAASFHSRWKTMDLGGSRGLEIERWLADEEDLDGNVYNYVIIDDTPDFLQYQQSRFVQCDIYDGFGFRQYMHTIKLLSNGKVGLA